MIWPVAFQLKWVNWRIFGQVGVKYQVSSSLGSSYCRTSWTILCTHSFILAMSQTEIPCPIRVICREYAHRFLRMDCWRAANTCARGGWYAKMNHECSIQLTIQGVWEGENTLLGNKTMMELWNRHWRKMYSSLITEFIRIACRDDDFSMPRKSCNQWCI